mgnify:CR=1 FL=1
MAIPPSPPGVLYTPGAASPTDNAIVRWDGTTGRFIQNSGATLADTGALTLSGGIYVGNGALATPSISFANDTDKGFYLKTGGGYEAIGISIDGASEVALGSGNSNIAKVVVSISGSFGWSNSSSAISGTNDLVLTRPAAATLQLGFANAAAPVSQTIRAQGSRSGTDTNIAGGNLTLEPGLSTGNATPAAIILQSPVPVASGTGAQTITVGLVVKNGTAKVSSYTVATLPSASLSGQGALAIVSDATLTTITGLGLAPTGGGANIVPVYSDGTNWLML